MLMSGPRVSALFDFARAARVVNWCDALDGSCQHARGKSLGSSTMKKRGSSQSLQPGTGVFVGVDVFLAVTAVASRARFGPRGQRIGPTRGAGAGRYANGPRPVALRASSAAQKAAGSKSGSAERGRTSKAQTTAHPELGILYG